ncbi:glucose/galactose transporter [Duganella sp. CF458]|uniref:sugar MFS transporter n=1 Tax=Duganella sp. CF458 TaxID=1884368 RepID=UPI0008EFAAC7|nr:sugar MFS transporter [Duganella sp. CF458]SFF59794.1 glucose/galactose transporter [Duganella sp. CF458]
MHKEQTLEMGGTQAVPGASVAVAMTFIGLMFFILGCATWLNGSLIPFLKIACDLNNFQSLWVTFAFYIAYTLMALPSAAVLRRTGYRAGMSIGLAVMAFGAVLFIPAARAASYPLFLLALFTLASGMTLMQTAINPYIVCIGARESAAMRISVMGLFNKTAGVLVPLVFSGMMLSDFGQYSDASLAAMSATDGALLRSQLAQRLVLPYGLMAAGLLAMAVIVRFAPLSEIPGQQAGSDEGTSRWGVLQFPQLVLGALALFVYVGVEVIAGDTIGLYGHSLHVDKFGILTSYTMGFMVAGYIVGIVAIPRWLSQKQALLLSAVCGIVFSFGVIQGSATGSGLSQAMLGPFGVPAVPDTVMFLAMLGFANALVWPAIWPLALEGLGRYTASGSALLIMGIAGGALLPMLYGHLSDVSGSQAAYWLLLPCYALILFYAVKGHKMTSWR